MRKLEQVLTTYLRNPNKLPAKRPTIRVGAVFGCCGGRQHDAIVFLTAKIERLEAHIEQLRETIDDRKAQPYGFASFLKVPYAHLVAKTMEGKRPSGTTIELAPRPTGASSRPLFFGLVFILIVPSIELRCHLEKHG